MAERRGTASARPERLTNLAETTGAIIEAVKRRAGWLDESWDVYTAGNGADWRFDFSAVGEAVRAWARTLGDIGEWTGLVGQAFTDAGGRESDGVCTVRESRLLDLLPCDARALVEATELAEEVDWGDPDDPPAWLDDLQQTAMALGHVDGGVEVAEVAFVVGAGADARWHAATPAILGRFATARSMSGFARLFSVGTAGLGGFTAGVEQWLADSGSYNYTDGEVRARTTARVVATGGTVIGASALGAAGAGLVCTAGAPVCAGAVILVTGLAVTGISDRAVDWALGSPGPAEHDPDVVEDEVDGLAPGYLPRDVSDAEWDLLEAIDSAGDEAGEHDFAVRNHAILTPELSPEVVDAYTLPPSWVEAWTR